MEALSLALIPAAPIKVQVDPERAALIETIHRHRQNLGLPPADLKGRSRKQLKKMVSQISDGNPHYRMGRQWKQPAH